MSNLEAKADETLCEAHGVRDDRVLEARIVPLGGVKGVEVERTLPHRELPMIGAFCFLDHFGPTQRPGRIEPHPHTGLQTVTWLYEGAIRHRDSVGSDVIVSPGQLNLMTSGTGIAHSEYDLESTQHGFQMWVALPDDARFGRRHFEQHSDLPRYTAGSIVATVAIGSSGGVESPALSYTPLLAVSLAIGAGSGSLALDPRFEHGLVLASGSARVDGMPIDAGPLHYFAPGRDTLRIEADAGASAMLIGGTPFDEDIVMWWNFVGRSHDEIVRFRESWESGDEFTGHVVGHGAERIPAPPMPNVQLKARRRRD